MVLRIGVLPLVSGHVRVARAPAKKSPRSSLARVTWARVRGMLEEVAGGAPGRVVLASLCS